jgi:hypothetical protein
VYCGITILQISTPRYWRVDSDSFLLGPLKHDPIRKLSDSGSIYGYMALGREDEYLTTGLWAATQKHIKERNVKPTYLKQVSVVTDLTLSAPNHEHPCL